MRETSGLIALVGVVLAVFASSVSADNPRVNSFLTDSNVVVDPALYSAVQSDQTVYAYVTESQGKQGYQVNFGRVSTGKMAWCTFKPTFNETGWATLEVHTNSSYDDVVQMTVAGYLEGFVTAVSISQTVANLGVDKYCREKSTYCTALDDFLVTNSLWAEDMMKKATSLSGDERAFGRQYQLISDQVLGLLHGYNALAENASLPALTARTIQFMLFNSDIDTLETALGKSVKRDVLGSGSCSAMVKVIGDYEDILFTHDTWTEYATMLRIYKYYDFPVRRTSDAAEFQLIAGKQMSFSSYPGMVYSVDDFYQMKSGLAVMETTIGNYNKELFNAIVPDTAMYSYRVMIANRLATSGKQWADVFSMYNSGTYNNQWMVFDFTKFVPHHRLDDGAFTVLEQLPTMVHYEDMTQYLRGSKYWPSYNLPHFKKIFAAGNFQSMVDRFGDFFDYQLSPRRRIFNRDHHKVTGVASLKHFMRYNDYQHDENGRCTCSPPYSGENGIAARSDLNPVNGTYLFPALGHRLHGATDCKITSSGMMSTLQSHAIVGPTNEQQPTFKWSTAGVDARPLGHPDVFNHDFIVMEWEEV